MATYITSRYRLSVEIIHGTICVWEVILHLVRTQHCCYPLVQLLPLNMRHCREQKQMERTLSTFSKAHQWPECYVTLFLFGVQNELHLREQWGSGRDGCLLAQQGKELLYFAPRVPSLPLICAVGQWTDSVGQHLIIRSYQSERLAYKNALRWAECTSIILARFFRPPFPEPHMCAARSKQGEGQQRAWLGGLRACGEWGWGRGVALRFLLSASHVENVWFSRWLTRLKTSGPKYTLVFYSARAPVWKADEVCFCTCVIFFVPLAKNVPIPPRSSQGDFFFSFFSFLRI